MTQAPAEGGEVNRASGPDGFGMAMPLLILIPFAAILLWQSRSQQKKTEATISSLKKGDRVITQSGLVGRLRSIDARYAEIELPPSGTRVTVLRSGLLGRDAEGESPSADKK